MPDWTYQTVFRPALFALGAETGRRLAFGFMGTLARLPLGRHVIQLMGHMKPDKRLAIERNGIRFPTAVGLGCAIDPHLSATPAFAEFGFGFLEIGPIGLRPPAVVGAIRLDAQNESLAMEQPVAQTAPQIACERLRHDGPLGAPVIARIEPSSSEEAAEILKALGPTVNGVVVHTTRLGYIQEVIDTAATTSLGVFLCGAIDNVCWRDVDQRNTLLDACRAGWLCGVIVGAVDDDQQQRLGKTDFLSSVETVRAVRKELGPQPFVVGSVGVHSPADALDYIDAGADMVQVDSGLVFSGPGLPKRINEALLYRRLAKEGESESDTGRIGSQPWFWAMLMGLSMLMGGALAMLVATTRVVLPYDESMAGLTRNELAQINPHLLDFMTHDRVTLAGTMLAVGTIYVTLAWWGIRRGVHWACLAVIISAFAGFFTFFSFLGFGYFDPFHAFVTAILFQFLLLTIHSHLPDRHRMEAPDLWNDGRWRANQWGQLLFVMHGAILICAGLVISSVGMTTVFVPEDLEFMRTSAADLFGAHPQLVPLVAHDRATFGGMLISCGVVTLLPALWGFRRGQAWLWWALMIAGTIAYGSTIAVHWTVGYDSLKHLLPAYGGLAWLWMGGLASYWFLVARDRRLEAEWERRLEARGD